MDLSLVAQMLLRLSPKRAQQALRDSRLFFVVGLGRSGTTFLAHLLDKAPECSVYHESWRDRSALIDAYWDSERAIKYLSQYRLRLIAARILLSQYQVYGEINSYLRYHVNALRELWQPIILHLVRDGRSVVRSVMNRKAFLAADKNHTGRLMPKGEEKMAAGWSELNRFQKVCWYWSSTNSYLLNQDLGLIRFEDISRDYGSFERQVLQPLGITVSYDVWRGQIQNPRNVSKKNEFPEWQAWTDEQKSQFRLICGEVMTKLGYVI